MHNIEVKIIDLPIFELFLADWFNAVMVMEGIPQFRYQEKVRAFNEAVFDGACYAFAALSLIAII